MNHFSVFDQNTVMNIELPNKREQRSDTMVIVLWDYIQGIHFTGPRGFEDNYAKYLDKWIVHGPVILQAPTASCYQQVNGIPIPCGHSHISTFGQTLPNMEIFKWYTGMMSHEHGIIFAGFPPFPYQDSEYLAISNKEQGYAYIARLFTHITQFVGWLGCYGHPLRGSDSYLADGSY
jgi:hypothetical protein